MKYLIDTCVISDFIKGEEGTLSRVKAISPDEIAISSISVMEVHYGLLLNPARTKSVVQVIHDFLASIHILAFDQYDAREAAAARTFLKQAGSPIGSYDILLAGTALNRKLIFVSANTKEFNRIEGLTLENWRNSHWSIHER